MAWIPVLLQVQDRPATTNLFKKKCAAIRHLACGMGSAHESGRPCVEVYCNTISK